MIDARFDLKNIDFLETDSKKITDDIIKRFEKITERSLAQGDPVRVFLQSIAYEIILLRFAVNNAAKQTLLTYATGEHLDHLGILLNTTRIKAKGATTTIKFTLVGPQTSNYNIPKNTLVTDGNITFSTTKAIEIVAGEINGEVTATAIEKDLGAKGNNINIGFINKMIEPLAFMQKVENIDISTGGADTENDEEFAERIRLATAAFSVAGPQQAYEYHCKTFGGAGMVDVKVYGLEDQPGKVFIHPLLKGGVIPEQAYLQELHTYLEPYRPLTDEVLISAPKPIDYRIELTWFLAREDTDRVNQIKEQVNKAIEDYRVYQQSQIGLDIVPDKLIAYIQNAGAKRCTLLQPVFTFIAQDEVAQCDIANINITYGGIEDK